MPSRLQIRGLLAAGLCALSGLAGAASLQVAPTGLEFLPSSPAQGLWLSNTGVEALNAQVRVFRWTQVDGEDVLTPTQDMVASPPMLSLQPGTRQLVRVIRVGAPTPGEGEKAYRLLVDELPPSVEPTETGIRYVLRHSVPAFVLPATLPDAAEVATSLEWSLQRSDDGLALQARNTGSFHAQLSQVSLLPPDGTSIEVSPGLLGYVLPDMTMRWSLKLVPAQLPAGTRLKVSINGKPVDQSFPVGNLAH